MVFYISCLFKSERSRRLSNGQKVNQIENIHEKEQYSNAKNLILPKPRPKKIKKKVSFKILKSEARKFSEPYHC